MSRKFLLSILPLFLLSACAQGQNTSENVDYDFDGDEYVDVMPSKTENGNIFHAFCWKFTDITAKLPQIAEQAFKSIQISPVQQPKNGGPKWWSFYQPLSFSIADNSTLGTKAELTELCTEADKYGIAIIADVVLNHMANIDEDHLEPDGTPTIYPAVENYEPYLYQHRNDSGSTATFHHNMNATGSGAVTQKYAFPGSILPDLNTANPYVQERALSLLKECIDVGIDGFRLDAAKHIETPTDPQYASDYFPNVINGAKEYYKTKTGRTNDTLYVYGEILGEAEGGRKISDYTPYIDVTDNGAKSSYISATARKDASVATRGKYSKECDPSQIVTWAESHDDYCNGESIADSMSVNKVWAMMMARKGGKGLYFARSSDRDTVPVGTIGSYLYEDTSVGAINRFHNRFQTEEEYVSSIDANYICERYSEENNGAVIVNVTTKATVDNTVTVKFAKIPNGVYFDQMTGEKIEVRNRKATINFHASKIAILTRSNNKARPYLKISNRGASFLGTLAINFELQDATGTYQINNQSPVSFTGKVNLTLDQSMADNGNIILKIRYGNEQFSGYEQTFKYTVVQLIEGYFNVIGLNPDYFTNNEIYLWSWGSGAGHWSKDYIIQDGRLLINLTTFTDTSFLIGLFAKNYVITNVNAWDSSVVKQTSDISISDKFFDASNF